MAAINQNQKEMLNANVAMKNNNRITNKKGLQICSPFLFDRLYLKAYLLLKRVIKYLIWFLYDKKMLEAFIEDMNSKVELLTEIEGQEK